MNPRPKTRPLHVLVGDLEENFYHLGVKDRPGFQVLSEHLKALMGSGLSLLDIPLEQSLKLWARGLLSDHPPLKKLLAAYSEGLQLSATEVLSVQLIPEFLSFAGHMLPGLPPFPLGCSSAFCLDESQELLHGRVLDFPLVGSFDAFERIVQYKLSSERPIWSYGTQGLMFAGLSAINEAGVSLALHQKYSRQFDWHGLPVFYLAHRLLQEVSSVAELKLFVKKMKPLTLWGFNLGFAREKKALWVDWGPETLTLEEHALTAGVLYTNNRPLQGDPADSGRLMSFHHYCEQRSLNFARKAQRHPPRSGLELLQLLASLSPTQALPTQDTLTSSSLDIVVFKGATSQAWSVAGPAPKFADQGAQHFQNIFERPEERHHPLKKKHPQSLRQGLRALAWAQHHLDRQEPPQALHYLQTASAWLEDGPYRGLAQFYELMMRYLCMPPHQEFSGLYLELQNKLPDIPPPLNEHALLLRQRLEKYLKLPLTAIHCTSPRLQALAQYEADLPWPLLLQYRKLTHLRSDVWDVVYLYFKG